MKYLDNPTLLQLSHSLSDIPTPEYKVNVRFEAYSVKPIGKEKKMYKEMEEAYQSEQEGMDEMSFSPEMRDAGLSSCFGRLDKLESRKVHFLLVSTLNAAFPDHDFSALRPDQFTREPASSQVMANITSTLMGPAGSAPYLGHIGISPTNSTHLQHLHQGGVMNNNSGSMSSSSGSPSSMIGSGGTTHPDVWRILNEVIPMDECEVYSWFPEPEYDPHVDPEDGELSDDDYEEEEEQEEMLDDLEMDMDPPATWGQAGMDLDDGATSSTVTSAVDQPPRIGRTSSGERERERRAVGLLWSQNYFFYSKRTKRVLFLTCWCRKRPSHVSNPDEDSTAFPQAISSSFTPPTSMSFQQPSQIAAAKALRQQRIHNRTNHRPTRRKSKINIKAAGGKPDIIAATIPIRGMETPPRSSSSRLAVSAPSTFNLNGLASPQAALAKMNVGGFRPKQTPARIMINAAKASQKKPA